MYQNIFKKIEKINIFEKSTGGFEKEVESVEHFLEKNCEIDEDNIKI